MRWTHAYASVILWKINGHLANPNENWVCCTWVHRGTMSNLYMICHFTNSHPSYCQNHGTHSLNIVISNGCRPMSCSFMCCVIVSELANPFIRQSTMAYHCSHTMVKALEKFQSLVYLQSTKKRSLLAAFLWSIWKVVTLRAGQQHMERSMNVKLPHDGGDIISMYVHTTSSTPNEI